MMGLIDKRSVMKSINDNKDDRKRFLSLLVSIICGIDMSSFIMFNAMYYNGIQWTDAPCQRQEHCLRPYRFVLVGYRRCLYHTYHTIALHTISLEVLHTHGCVDWFAVCY
jgi:hypothetical protein